MIVSRAISALIATAHLTNVHLVELVSLYDRFVELFGSVIVIDKDGQIAGHVGHRVLTFKRKFHTRLIVVQRVKIENTKTTL